MRKPSASCAAFMRRGCCARQWRCAAMPPWRKTWPRIRWSKPGNACAATMAAASSSPGSARFCSIVTAIPSARSARCPFPPLREHDQNEPANALGQLAAHESLPDEAAQRREEAALVQQCIDALPAKHQQVIHLRFYVDDSLEGIAAALGCSVGTVKSRLFHALDKLRAHERAAASNCGQSDHEMSWSLMKPCFSKRKLIAWLALGELDARRAQDLRAHIETCDGCRRYLEEISAVKERAGRRGDPGRTLEASESFHRRLVGRLRAEQPASLWETPGRAACGRAAELARGPAGARRRRAGDRDAVPSPAAARGFAAGANQSSRQWRRRVRRAICRPRSPTTSGWPVARWTSWTNC